MAAEGGKCREEPARSAPTVGPFLTFQFSAIRVKKALFSFRKLAVFNLAGLGALHPKFFLF